MNPTPLVKHADDRSRRLVARKVASPAINLLQEALVLRLKDHPLPCSGCPHQSACCAWGTSLTPAEARRLLRSHGPGTVYRTRWNEWRTRVRGGRCVFLVDNACVLHETPSYPSVCRGFPLTDGSGKKPYGMETDICPELVSLTAGKTRVRPTDPPGCPPA